MKLLVCTQKVDKNDPILGFFHRWIEEFAKHWEYIHVICLQEGSPREISRSDSASTGNTISQGDHELPDNVEVYSLGKEKGTGKLKQLFTFYFHLSSLGGKYDSIFVHMNQEYLLLAGLYWRLFGKRIGFWYNHTIGSVLTKIAMQLSNVVFHTSPYAYTAGTEKSRRMPAGIDTKLFTPEAAEERKENSLLFVGRIAPLKGVQELILACQKLSERGVEFSLDIYGSARPEDEGYEQKCRQSAEGLPIQFHGSVTNTELPEKYASHEIFINLTPAGNYDKTVLEAMACGSLVVASSKAFSDIIPDSHRPPEDNSEILADVLEQAIRTPASDKAELREEYQAYVKEKHAIEHLSGKVKNVYAR